MRHNTSTPKQAPTGQLCCIHQFLDINNTSTIHLITFTFMYCRSSAYSSKPHSTRPYHAPPTSLSLAAAWHPACRMYIVKYVRWGAEEEEGDGGGVGDEVGWSKGGVRGGAERELEGEGLFIYFLWQLCDFLNEGLVHYISGTAWYEYISCIARIFDTRPLPIWPCGAIAQVPFLTHFVVGFVFFF